MPAWGGEDAPAPDEIRPTRAMSLSLDQLLEVQVDKVYGASRYEQRITEAPSSVSVVTRDEIEKQGHRTLAEVLKGVRGLYITTDRVYSYLGIRGFGRPSDYNSRVLVLIDGHRVNDNIFDGALLGTESVVDVGNIERVEVVRGPSSSLYGDNAFFGVINVITRSGAAVNGLEVTAWVGGNDSYKGRLSYGRVFTNGLELLLSGSWYESAGERRLYYREFDDVASNNGVARNSDADQAYKASARLGYGDFTLNGSWSRRTKQIPTASFETLFNSGREVAVDEYAYADLKFQHTVNERLELMARAYYDFYSFEGEYPYNSAAPGNPIIRVLNKNQDRGEWAGTEFQTTAQLGGRIKAVGGVSFRGDLRQYQTSYDVNPRTVYQRADTPSWNMGFYGQVEVTVLSNLLVSGGLRYDYYDTFGGTLNPRLSVIYSPWRSSTLKLLYGQAYRAPNSFESYQASLDPESVRTYELVWEQQLPAHLRFTSAAYRYEVQHLISDIAGSFQNVGGVSAHGVELELDGRWESGVTARASYALQRAEDDRTHQELSNSPRHLGKGSLSVPLYVDKVFAGLELQYYSSVGSRSGRDLGDYVVANLTLSTRELVRGVSLSASVYNLFDTRFRQPVPASHLQDSVAQPGREFRVKLTYRF